MSAPDSKQAPHGANRGCWIILDNIYIYLCMYAYIYAHIEKKGS